MMIGREYRHVFPEKPAPRRQAAPVIEVAGPRPGPIGSTTSPSTARPGEIVGLGGLDGQGQRELLLALFGVLASVTGDVAVDGSRVRIDSPRAAKASAIGMALIPEDRKTEGLMLPMSVGDNLSFAALHRLSRGWAIDRAAEKSAIDRMIAAPADPHRRHRHPGRRAVRAATSRRW